MEPLRPLRKRVRGDGMVIKQFPGYFLILCLVLAFLFLYDILRPFLTALILAAILATVFYPLYQRILKFFGGRARLASIIACLLMLVLIIVPLTIFILLLLRQAFDTFEFIKLQIAQGYFDPYLKWEQGGIFYDYLNSIRGYLNGLVNIDTIDIKAQLLDAVQYVSTFLARQTATIVTGFLSLLLGLFIMFFALYYFFKDAKAIIKKIMIVSPLPSEYEIEVFRKFKEISLATLHGIFLTSIVQGIIGGIGFAIVGIPNALFWGTAIAIFSLVPVIGTSIVWLPAGLVLLATGNIFGGVFILLWGGLLISTVDNFLRAYLIGGRTNTNQLLMFLAVFGGISIFGLVGVIFGPLVLTLFFTFIHIYEMEYDKVFHHMK